MITFRNTGGYLLREVVNSLTVFASNGDSDETRQF